MVVKRCTYKDCKAFGITRGLCHKHYNELRFQIVSGKLTWEQAEERGLCAKAQPKRIQWSKFVKGT